MVRNSFYLITGSLWTLTSTFAFLSVLRAIEFYFETGLVLVSVMVFGLILFVAAGAMRSQVLRFAGTVFHVLYPLAWAQSVAASSGSVLGLSELGVLALSALVGSGLCDYGVYLDWNSNQWEEGGWELTSFDPGLLGVAPNRTLAACDSGAFSTLPGCSDKGTRGS